jgi:tRNA threonylcarbamoyladenosine biosynthesis protein TsaB
MPRILAIDTTAESGSIALLSDGNLVEQVTLHSPDGFGQILFQHIQRLLDRHGLTARQIDCFAAAAGPGSFTGVRIGLTAAKGLAEAAGKPVVAVSNLKALAASGEGDLRAPLMDARRGEIYGAVYSATLAAVSPEVVIKFPVWIESLPPHATIIAADLTAFATVIGDRFKLMAAPRELAYPIASIAHDDLLLGNVQDPAAIDANYVRRSDAELLWKDRP